MRKIVCNKYYKFVLKREGKYLSIYDNDFEYTIGNYAEARKNIEYWGNSEPVLFFIELNKVSCSTYRNEKDTILIEVEIESNNIVNSNRLTIAAKKCKVIREVPEEEYCQYL